MKRSAERFACPCCGYATLHSRGDYQICHVCFWEDEGQDSDDADENRGPPNGMSLTEGRRNYLQHGVSELKCRDHIRPPRDDEPRVRVFELEGDEVVERTPVP